VSNFINSLRRNLFLKVKSYMPNRSSCIKQGWLKVETEFVHQVWVKAVHWQCFIHEEIKGEIIGCIKIVWIEWEKSVEKTHMLILISIYSWWNKDLCDLSFKKRCFTKHLLKGLINELDEWVVSNCRAIFTLGVLFY